MWGLGLTAVGDLKRVADVVVGDVGWIAGSDPGLSGAVWDLGGGGYDLGLGWSY